MAASEEHAAWSRLTFGSNLEALAADADLVIEAAVEDLRLKRLKCGRGAGGARRPGPKPGRGWYEYDADGRRLGPA